MSDKNRKADEDMSFIKSVYHLPELTEEMKERAKELKDIWAEHTVDEWIEIFEEIDAEERDNALDSGDDNE